MRLKYEPASEPYLRVANRCEYTYTSIIAYVYMPRGGVRPFHQKLTCTKQITLGPYVVQIWSRNIPNFGPNETRVAHRAVPVQFIIHNS